MSVKVNFFLISSVACLIATISCKNHRNTIENVELKRDTIIIQLSDSSFLSDVRSMYIDKYLYLTDYNRDQLLILNHKGDLIKSLGAKGKGPGEFLGAAHIFVWNDTIYVANDSKRSIEMFEKSGHLKTIILPGDIMLFSAFRFFLKCDNLYLASPSDSNSVISLNIDSYSLTHFGELFAFELSNQKYYKNLRHLFYNKDYFIAISDNMPIIEKYDFSGKLISQFDYSTVPIVKERLEFITRRQKEEKSYYLLINDAYMYNDILYILLCTNSKEKIHSNQILSINLKKDSVQCVYDLGNGWFSSICLKDNYLWGFNKTESGLSKFKISN